MTRTERAKRRAMLTRRWARMQREQYAPRANAHEDTGTEGDEDAREHALSRSDEA